MCTAQGEDLHRIVNSRFDTTVLLPNTTGYPFAVLLTVRDAGGATLWTYELEYPMRSDAGTRAV